jgi:hypothetical protein
MGYIEEFLFGAPEIKFDKPRSETLEGGFAKLVINGREYMGKKVFIDIKGGGKIKEFWVGAVEGDDAVKIINFRDPSALTALQQKAGKANRAATTDDRSHMREDDRSHLREDDRPKPGENDEPGETPEVELPPLAKTGARVVDAAVTNVINQLKDGNSLKEAQKRTLINAKAEERKAAMGALVDALIDAHQGGKRREKATISAAMFEVWANFARNEGFSKADMVYDFEGRTQSAEDDVIRRWILVYNKYKP